MKDRKTTAKDQMLKDGTSFYIDGHNLVLYKKNGWYSQVANYVYLNYPALVFASFFMVIAITIYGVHPVGMIGGWIISVVVMFWISQESQLYKAQQKYEAEYRKGIGRADDGNGNPLFFLSPRYAQVPYSLLTEYTAVDSSDNRCVQLEAQMSEYLI